MKIPGYALFALGCGALLVLAPASGDEAGQQDVPEADAPITAVALSAPRAVVTDGLAIGDPLDPARLHVITRPGLYGLTGNRSDRFGLLDGKLLRYDPGTMQLRAILRTNVPTLD